MSEQALAEELMDRLPAGAVMEGDRNFGVFSIAYAASEKQLPVILRLTRQRFEKLAGAAAVAGRLLVAQMQTGSATEFLYLFTTLTVSAEQILELYRCRWNIETDLRSFENHDSPGAYPGQNDRRDGEGTSARLHSLQFGPRRHGISAHDALCLPLMTLGETACATKADQTVCGGGGAGIQPAGTFATGC